MNNFKKIFAILPLILGGAVILPSCSCNANPEDIIDPDEKTRKITLGVASLNMDVSETNYITVNTSKCNFQSADFTITSTNPSVATVTKTSINAGGDAIRVDSHKEGVTSVTAHCKNVTATCTVTVIDSCLAPIIKLDESAISIVKGTKYNINLSLFYKGEEVTDNVSFAYSCYTGEDAASLKVTKGREGYYLTATALGAGNATYYITASYLDKIIAPVELDISVLDTVISYDVKNAELTPTGYLINLYTVEDSFELKAPTSTGYTEFKGWHLNSPTGAVINKIDKGTKGDIALYAEWGEAIPYKINYIMPDESKFVADHPTTYTVAKDVKLVDAKMDGFVFLGWFIIVESDSDFLKPTI